MNSTVFSKKNKFVIFIIALVVILPTVIACIISARTDNTSVILHRINEIAVSLPSSENADFSFTDEEDFSVYTNAIENARLIDADFKDLSNEVPFTVTVNETDDITKKYNFYIANVSDGCIFTDEAGKYYLIDSKDALELLKRTEYSSINTLSVIPTVTQTRGSGKTYTAYASDGTWSYVAADGSVYEADIQGSSESDPFIISLSDIGSLSFSSEKQPDTVTVTLVHGGEKKHSGAFENLINASTMSPDDVYYDAVITATWNEEEGAECFGTINYKTTVLYDVAPTYSLIYKGVVSKGDFTILKMQNFNDGDKLFAECDYSVPAELNVYRSASGGYSFAFVPAKYTNKASATYNLKLSLEDGSSQTVKLSVRDGRAPSSANQEGLVSDVALSEAATAAAYKEFEDIVAKATETSESRPLWDGKFVYPDGKGSIETGFAGFGTQRKVQGLETLEYMNEGLDISLASGADVPAANNGKVVFASELEFAGNTVIIDHGCSIFTIYCNLDSISVAVGDTVSLGAIVGKAGSTGFACCHDGVAFIKAPMVHFAASVNGVFVNPYYLCKSGVDFND